MFSRTPKFRVTLGFCCFGLVLACNQILDIEEASYDARLSGVDPSTPAGSGGSTSGQAGALTSAGTSGTSNAGSSQGGTHSHGIPNPSAAAGAGGDDDSEPEETGGSNSGSAGTNHGHQPGDAGSDGEGGSAGEDHEGHEPEDACETYCDEMDAQCQGVATQYIDKNQCLRVCRLLPAGESDGPDENSVACRLKYAKKAHYALGSEVTAYCHQAGPSGEGHCGSACEAFCSLMETVCTAEIAGIYHFASNEECLATCEALPPAPVSYSSSDPLIADGNHALCRLFHVTSAAMADPEEHCEHSLGVTLCEAPAL